MIIYGNVSATCGKKTEDAFIKQELLALATVCEEVAINIEDRLASG